jgi:hypothetical protein
MKIVYIFIVFVVTSCANYEIETMVDSSVQLSKGLTLKGESVHLVYTNNNVPKLVFSGLYIGKNIYVQNPFKGNELGFCIDSIIINDTLKRFEGLNSPVIEIDLNMFEKCKDSITIKIYHSKDCLPRILNPEIISPKITTEFESILIDSTGVLTWTTINESWKGQFNIQKLKDSTWLKVKSIESFGRRMLS